MSSLVDRFASWHYQPSGKRDLRLDWLRGFAVFVMAINHLQISSLYQFVTGNGAFLISAAEGFYFISGYTLGLISVDREIKVSVRRIGKRVWEIYLAVISLAFGLAAMSVILRFPLDEISIGSIRGLGVWMAEIFSMQRAFFHSNILIPYVVYLSLAAPALWAMKKGRTWVVLVLLGMVYWASQLNPGAVDLPFATLRNLAANTPIFFGGLVIGYHSERLRAAWDEWKYSWIADVLVAVCCVILIAGFPSGYSWMPAGWSWLREYQPVLRIAIMPFHYLLFTILFLRFFFILVTWLWRPMSWLFGRGFTLFGRRSLVAFILHLILVPLFHLIPGVDRISSVWTGTAWATVYLAILYGLVLGYDHIRGLEAVKSEQGQKFFDRLGLGLTVALVALFVGVMLWEIVPDYVWYQKLPFLFPK